MTGQLKTFQASIFNDISQYYECIIEYKIIDISQWSLHFRTYLGRVQGIRWNSAPTTWPGFKCYPHIMGKAEKWDSSQERCDTVESWLCQCSWSRIECDRIGGLTASIAERWRAGTGRGPWSRPVPADLSKLDKASSDEATATNRERVI